MEIERLTQEVVDHFTEQLENTIIIQTALNAFTFQLEEEEKDGG